MAEERKYPAGGIVRNHLLAKLEDLYLVTLVGTLRIEVAALETREGAWYNDRLVLDLCDAVLHLPAGLIVSEFVPEPIRNRMREAVALASKIRGQIHHSLVDDFGAFVEDLTAFSEVLSEVFQEL